MVSLQGWGAAEAHLVCVWGGGIAACVLSDELGAFSSQTPVSLFWDCFFLSGIAIKTQINLERDKLESSQERVTPSERTISLQPGTPYCPCERCTGSRTGHVKFV